MKTKIKQVQQIVSLLKQNNIDNITLVTKDNINSYQNILNILKEGTCGLCTYC